jgi:hypothetical protein
MAASLKPMRGTGLGPAAMLGMPPGTAWGVPKNKNIH